MSKKGNRSMPEYLHSEKKETIKAGEKVVSEETIIDGEKGVTIKYFHKSNSSTLKIVMTRHGDKYNMKTISDGKVEEKELTKDEFMKELKSNKNLKFASDFAKTMKGGSLLFKGGSKAKKGSKTKKASKSGSKSKKGSKQRGGKAGSKSKKGSKGKRN